MRLEGFVFTEIMTSVLKYNLFSLSLKDLFVLRMSLLRSIEKLGLS